MVRQIQTIKPARIDVIGRADASGPEDYNYGLSECRARSVADALKARGAPAGIDVRIIPLGKNRPHRADPRRRARSGQPRGDGRLSDRPQRAGGPQPGAETKKGPLQLRRPASPLPARG